MTVDDARKFLKGSRKDVKLADGAMKLAKEFAEKSKSEAEPEKKG